MKKRFFALVLSTAALFSCIGANAASFSVNDEVAAQTIKENDTVFVPLREAAGALGYDIEWIAESKSVNLSKDAEFITFSMLDNNGDEKAPRIINNKTYVPLEFFTDTLALNVSIDEENINVIYDTDVARLVDVIEVNGEQITVNDSSLGEVVLHISDLAEIEENKQIAVGDKLEVVYGDQMMESMPPQNVPKSIKVVSSNADSEAGKAELSITGVVTAIEDGLIVVESDNAEDSYKLVALNPTDNTTGDADVKVGDRINATFSEAMTRSIPPQAEAYSISIEK